MPPESLEDKVSHKNKTEYMTEQLHHDDETSSKMISEILNGNAKLGWKLHSTQFLPTTEPNMDEIGSGFLLLIFHR